MNIDARRIGESFRAYRARLAQQKAIIKKHLKGFYIFQVNQAVPGSFHMGKYIPPRLIPLSPPIERSIRDIPKVEWL